MTVDEVIANGGMECGNCDCWRIMKERPYKAPVIETCTECGDEEFDIFIIEDELP